jgi:hypothetical protein
MASSPPATEVKSRRGWGRWVGSFLKERGKTPLPKVSSFGLFVYVYLKWIKVIFSSLYWQANELA